MGIKQACLELQRGQVILGKTRSKYVRKKGR